MTTESQNTSACGSPFVVHCKRSKHDVYIGRPSKWGNPFEIGKDGDRETVIRKYREWVVTQPHLMAALPELSGKVLGCWCAPQACHGDVLVSLANVASQPRAARELERENIMLREALEACSVFVTPLERLKNWNEYKAHAAELRRLALANEKDQPR
jgi:hypothetical protein